MQGEASRTAVLVCQGRAVAHERVGTFRDPVAIGLLREHEREVVEQVRRQAPPRSWRARLDYEFVRGCGALMAPRTFAIDEAIGEHPPGQLVILGAGLDTRAWRIDALATTVVFEVDHPATQTDKRARVVDLAPVAAEVRFVATDFTEHALGAALERAGHAADVPTTWVWEGVVPYLTAEQVETTVVDIALRSTPGSRLIVNYNAPSARAGFGQLIGRAMMRLSGSTDPWRAEPHRSHWTPAQMADLLAHHGFATHADRNLLEVARTLELPRDDLGGSLPSQHVLVADRP